MVASATGAQRLDDSQESAAATQSLKSLKQTLPVMKGGYWSYMQLKRSRKVVLVTVEARALRSF